MSLIVSLVQASGIRGELSGTRELRGDVKLLTGNVYELMAQKG